VFLVIVRKPIAMDDLHLLDERTFPRLSCPKQQKLQLFSEWSFRPGEFDQALTWHLAFVFLFPFQFVC